MASRALRGGGDGAVDILRGVRGGNEGGFELRWCEENAAVEHFAEEAGVALGVGALGAGVIADGLFGEEESAERAGGIDLAGNFCVDEGLAQAASEAVGFFGDVVVEA